MSQFIYFPLIKTRDSELRCFRHISAHRLEQILPIYELTKSRRTKLAPDGDIHRRMKEIEEIQGKRPFILDLTTDDLYLNAQIKTLLDDRDGFAEWQYFVFNVHKTLNIIPMIHLFGGDDLTEVKRFVQQASGLSQTHKLALRLPCDIEEDELTLYMESITSVLSGDCRLYVILDAGNCRSSWKLAKDAVIRSGQTIERFNSYLEDIVVVSTSFPKNVSQEGKGDETGRFPIFEEELYQAITTDLPIFKYGDYASINAEQVEVRATTFVPRIDIVSNDVREFSYKRYRRTEGGYVKCAQQVLSDLREYENLNTWADEEILLASKGTPNGISPSYWISVRMNYYIERVMRLRELCFKEY